MVQVLVGRPNMGQNDPDLINLSSLEIKKEDYYLEIESDDDKIVDSGNKEKENTGTVKVSVSGMSWIRIGMMNMIMPNMVK